MKSDLIAGAGLLLILAGVKHFSPAVALIIAGVVIVRVGLLAGKQKKN